MLEFQKGQGCHYLKSIGLLNLFLYNDAEFKLDSLSVESCRLFRRKRRLEEAIHI